MGLTIKGIAGANLAVLSVVRKPNQNAVARHPTCAVDNVECPLYDDATIFVFRLSYLLKFAS